MSEGLKRILVLVISVIISLPLSFFAVRPYSWTSGLREIGTLDLILLVPLVLALLVSGFREVGLIVFRLDNLRNGSITLILISVAYLASVLILFPFQTDQPYGVGVPIIISYIIAFAILFAYYLSKNKTRTNATS